MNSVTEAVIGAVKPTKKKASSKRELFLAGKSLVLRVSLYLLVVAIIVFSLFPFFCALVGSFRASNALFSTNLSPKSLNFDYYQAIFARPIFVGSLINSAIVAGSATLISLAIGSLCAYALARLPFRFKGTLLYLVLLLSHFPGVALLPGLFVLVRTLGLFNTRQGLVLTYLAFTIPFIIWVMTHHFRSVSKDLEDAAYVDGASPLIVFWRISLPLAMPGLFSTGLVAFIGAWNEYLFALTFTMTNNQRTVPVVISEFSGVSPYEQPWGSILAASMVVTIPLVIVVLIFQNRILKGFSPGVSSWR
ncbi:MAG TPA: carbohydrate ABC transporter permease [Chthoniobacterales bacterium]|jgi:trehalose/maltose transport system permease protein|nr:carbohydrate ABC transporter permease [Chthoniobacterales bacterium]